MAYNKIFFENSHNGAKKEAPVGFSWTTFLRLFMRPAIFFLLVFSIFGCGKAELSRSSAKDMIQGSPKLKALTQSLPLNSAAGGKARALDILSRNGALTPKGSKLFSKFNYTEATLVQPVSPPNVDITGMASVPMAEDMKEVQFDLAFQLPPAIKRFAASGGKGVAHFRRYDDGWRLAEVNISMSSEPYPLTAQEQNEEQSEISAVASEILKRKSDLQKLVEKSRTPKKEIMKFSTGEVFFSGRGAWPNDVNGVVLHDTEIYVDVTPPPAAQSFGRSAGGPIHFPFKITSYMKYDQCLPRDPGLKIKTYAFLLLSDSYDSYTNQLHFPKKETCMEFKQKFEGAYQNWRNTYSEVFNSLAELQ